MSDDQKPKLDHVDDDETAIKGKGIGGVELEVPVRRSDMRWIVYSIALSLLILSFFFGWSLVK